MANVVRGLLALFLLLAAAPASAQQGNDPLARRADDVLRIIKNDADPATVFTPAFLAQVPIAQVRAISGQLIAQNGAALRIEQIERDGPLAGTIHVGFERNIVRMRLGIEAQDPHRVTNLLVTGSEPRGGDSAEAVIAEMRALPGQVSFQIARLGEDQPTSIAAHQPNRALAIGSTFKLIILAELSRQVGEGRLRWNQVVPIDRHSLPSGILQDWPLGSPLTVHSAAALMISRSDNTATDMLLRLAGRENIERMTGQIGMTDPRNRPFLSTIELFQLKADAPEARAQWAAADEAGRRRMLRERYEEGGAAINFANLFAGGPTAIDTIEWFASAADLARVLDHLRGHGDDTSRSIMAISTPLGPDIARRLSYVGFKGGSEPGVINMTFLVRNNAGTWYAVSGGWNNPAAPVDEGKFAGLMARAVNLVR